MNGKVLWVGTVIAQPYAPLSQSELLGMDELNYLGMLKILGNEFIVVMVLCQKCVALVVSMPTSAVSAYLMTL